MKLPLIQIGLAMVTGFSLAASAQDSFRRPTEAQQQAFAACMSQKGVAMPQRPERPALTDAQKAAFDNCKSQGVDREAMHSCLQAQGVEMPAPPNGGNRPSQDQMQAMQECRQAAVAN